MPSLPIRPRRLRQSEPVRRLVRETLLHPSRLFAECQAPPSMWEATRFAGLGGLFLRIPGELAVLEHALVATREAMPEACLAVDLRDVACDHAQAACAVRALGADILAVDGAETAAVRAALESHGEVNAIVMACAVYDWGASPLDDAVGAWVDAGADLVLVEPALSNLDRIRAAFEALPVPVVTRCTPEELAMYEAAIDAGMLDGAKIPNEVMTAMLRAGARAAVVPAAWAASTQDAAR